MRKNVPQFRAKKPVYIYICVASHGLKWCNKSAKMNTGVWRRITEISTILHIFLEFDF